MISPFLHKAQDDADGSLKVISSKNSDMSSVETILANILTPLMNQQDKTKACFEFLIIRTYLTKHQPPPRRLQLN